MKRVQIYTDGACSGNPGPGGYGAILLYDGQEKEISGGEPETTNNRMELTAAIEALQLLKEPCEVELFSDSSYLVNSFLEGWIENWARQGWKKEKGELKNTDLFQILYRLSQQHTITWRKVKGHSDNAYNNRCDRLAVDAVEAVKKAMSAETEPVPLRDQEYVGELTETVLTAQETFHGRVFQVELLDVQLPNGRVSKREVVRHSGGACVVAVEKDGSVYLVRQFRTAAGREMLEIPAGKLEPGEDPLLCATRELEEEIGRKAGTVRFLTSFYPTPGYCAEQLFLYLATDLVKSHPHRDENEFLHIQNYPLEEVLDLIQTGQIHDGKTIVGILLAARILGR